MGDGVRDDASGCGIRDIKGINNIAARYRAGAERPFDNESDGVIKGG